MVGLLSLLVFMSAVPTEDLGEPTTEPLYVNGWQVAAFRRGVRCIRASAEWVVHVEDMQLSKLRAKYSYDGEIVPSVVGKDSRRELAFIVVNLQAGSNVPLLLIELDLRQKRVIHYFESYGSGIGDCIVSPDGKTLACDEGSHSSACASYSHLLVVDLQTHSELAVAACAKADAMRKSGAFVNEIPIGWDEKGRLRMKLDSHLCSSDGIDLERSVEFAGLLDIAARAFVE